LTIVITPILAMLIEIENFLVLLMNFGMVVIIGCMLWLTSVDAVW
jgi:hypothetical protein